MLLKNAWNYTTDWLFNVANPSRLADAGSCYRKQSRDHYSPDCDHIMLLKAATLKGSIPQYNVN
jgi:hypothetical protein